MFDIIFACSMKHLLYLDTSDKKSLLLIIREGAVIAERSNDIQNNHGQVINSQIQEMMTECNLSWQQIDAICVLNGPGSYTGLRISLATAKGLCYAQSIPLILLNKLDLIYHSAPNIHDTNICSIIKARENEFFAALYSADGHQILPYSLLSKDDLVKEVEAHQAVLCVEDETYKAEFEQCTHVNVSFNDIISLCNTYFIKGNVADLLHSEPFYLKNVYINKINKL